MEKLRLDDSDTYWCGIERPGPDLGDHVDVTIDPGKSMCVCGHVSSGPALSRDPTVPQRECPRGGGVLRAHGAPLTTWAGRGRASPRRSPGSRAASGPGSGFPSTPFPCAQSVPESAPKEMKVVGPVSACGPRDPPLWDWRPRFLPALSWDPCCPGGVPALSGIRGWDFRAAMPTACSISHLRGKF